MATRKARRGNPLKAIGVVRVSTRSQRLGAESQHRELGKWATREGIELLAVYEDFAISGEAPLADRRGLQEAIVALRELGAGKLVAVKRDRFARHRHTIADVERAAHRAGAVLVTTDGVCTGEDTESAEVNASIQDLVAAMELRKIKARNQKRAQECIAQGRTHGGSLPYGQRRKASGVRGKSGVAVELQPDPSEQKVIKRVVALHESGLSLRGIAVALGEEGLAPRKGRTWQAMTIKRILARQQVVSTL